MHYELDQLQIIDQRSRECIEKDIPDPLGEENNCCIYIRFVEPLIYPALEDGCDNIKDWIYDVNYPCDDYQPYDHFDTICELYDYLVIQYGHANSDKIYALCDSHYVTA